MRLVPEIFEKVESRNFVGPNGRPNGRVTVEPLWTMKKTAPVYGNSIRGPFRYYSDGTGVEYEVPSIKSISWNRSKGQDVASCTIALYNSWHESNVSVPELAGSLGKKGFFWPKRGQGVSAQEWNQEPGKGAYRKDGGWEAGFSWENVLVEDAILRTYEGYGGNPYSGNFTSIDDNIDNNNIVLTGIWLIDTVTAGSNGIMTISCRDIGRLLLDQIVYPPLIPETVYPLDYHPEGYSPFDSPWGPKARTGVSPASRGEVKASGVGSWSGSSDASISSYNISKAIDGNYTTYALSEAYQKSTDGTVYFEFLVGQKINSATLKTFGGGFDCFVSVMVNGSWVGSDTVPTSQSGRNIAYLKKFTIPTYLQDGQETEYKFRFNDVQNETLSSAHYDADRVRFTFQRLQYSPIPDSSGYRYRAGIRDVIFYRSGANVSRYSPNINSLPWSFAIAAHPTRGYWVVDDGGTVHGFGDAANYDSSSAGWAAISPGVVHSNTALNYQAVAAESMPDGRGIIVLDSSGRVHLRGSAATNSGAFGSNPPAGSSNSTYHRRISSGTIPNAINYSNDPRVPANYQAVDIAMTHTGNGYWVLYADGLILGFGDATPKVLWMPNTALQNSMASYTANRFDYMTTTRWLKAYTGAAIGSYPNKMGFLCCNGSGEVWSNNGTSFIIKKSGLTNRTYNRGMGGEFKIGQEEYSTGLELTKTGNGYWISFGSGRIAAFGDAIDQGPVDVYGPSRGVQIDEVYSEIVFDPSFFRALIWDIVRDPDGKGFWVLAADGTVLSYDAKFWGQPGYSGLTGYRWHEGNFDGDYTQIIKDLLMWSGFLAYDNSITPTESPSALGRLESTGIKTDIALSGDKFDKKTIMDCIKELAEVTGYYFYIDELGGAALHSPNWWSPGNYDVVLGEKIYVEDGTFNRVASNAPNAVPFVPAIHEDRNMIEYSATISSADKRSEFIIGTNSPNPKDPTLTGYVKHVPPSANEMILPGVSSMRGIERPGIWVSQLFDKQEERQLMAELIGIHAWFAQRSGSVNCIGNPCLSIDDQVKLVERNTSETFTHLINSIDSNMDLDSGSYTMSISTNWLGDASDWVITNEPKNSDYPYVVISEPLNSWQEYTNRELQSTNPGSGGVLNSIFLSGGFSEGLVDVGELWYLNGVIQIDTQINLEITTDIFSPFIGLPQQATIKLFNSTSDLILNTTLPTVGQKKSLGTYGSTGQVTQLAYVISGTAASLGNGRLKVSFTSSVTTPQSVDSVIIVQNSEEEVL